MMEDIKYHGLRNQGATCYLNSILQALFMTSEFREAVESCSKHNEDDINVRLHTLFESLKEKTSETTEVTKTLRIEKVYEQQDAGQYLEKILSDVSKASEIFKGELIHRTVCDECGSHTEDVVPFFFLSLPLMDSSNENYSVEDGIQEFLKDVEFCGEDQMYCDDCKGKRDTTVKYKLKYHPEILILLLKRFEYNYQRMSYNKDNRAVDVCDTINVPENQTYELYALVEHFGTLTGGHYTATIKPEDEDRWYEFNDSSVTLLGDNRIQRKFEKSQSAHLLFYKKKGSQDEGQNGERQAEEEWKAEEERWAEEQKWAEEERKAEEESQAEVERWAEEERQAEEERWAEEQRWAEEERKAEEERWAEVERWAEEERKAEEERWAEEQKWAEEERKAEEESQAEVERWAEEERQAEEERWAEVERWVEEERKAEEERWAEKERKAEGERKAEEEKLIVKEEQSTERTGRNRCSSVFCGLPSFRKCRRQPAEQDIFIV